MRPAKNNTDGSMSWIKCAYLGLQIGDSRENLEESDKD